ncbi:fumarylacetoacetate hydrolase family protein [Cedecea colo]|uniref:FAA hydrolase family protein n=1 Tax=Cedecea colo TaxID=2552946 RepID=A0ABX0VNS3_9ENTR|nr:fumarylacetoacetate hydrolase family protein [Cedecea colo]NIY48710.1 FAA hydrolase family protein [Cedecea colo]
MKQPQFVTFSRNDGQQSEYGLINGQGVINLSRRTGDRWPDLKAVIQDGALLMLAQEYGETPADHNLSEITFKLPIQNPGKIICIGVNYPDRNAEYKDGQPAALYPSLFVRFPNSLTGHEQPILLPPESEQLDYEGEIAIVIGKGGRRIAPENALSHIAALTLCNEGTVRDWVRHSKFNVTQGKNFEQSGAMGPWLVPLQSAEQLEDIRLVTRVNGEIRQDDRTSHMNFSFAWIIEYLSTFTTLYPGDIIITGTPTGAGARLNPPVWLKAGDVVEVEAEGLGILRNRVRAEVPPC